MDVTTPARPRLVKEAVVLLKEAKALKKEQLVWQILVQKYSYHDHFNGVPINTNLVAHS